MEHFLLILIAVTLKSFHCAADYRATRADRSHQHSILSRQ